MRIKSLDGLRGIAACLVVFHHILLCLPGLGENRTLLFQEGFDNPVNYIYLTPLRLLVSGPAMVLLFFVLSGVVLGITFQKKDKQDYNPFIIKRIFRIWLPFSVAIILSFLLQSVLYSGPLTGVSAWFNRSNWSDPNTFTVLIQHLLMTGQATRLDNPMWSLIVEMQISLLFPLIFSVIRKRPEISMVGLIFVNIICAFIERKHILSGFSNTVVVTAGYTFLFAAGVWISLHMEILKKIYLNYIQKIEVLFLFIVVFSFCFSPETTIHIYSFSAEILILLLSFSCVTLITLAIFGRSSKFLSSPIILYLGDISYSLYLTHLVTITAILHGLNGHLSVISSMAVAILLILPVTIIFHKFVEIPSMKLGRRLVHGR